MTRRVPSSVFVIDRRGVEAQRRYAARLLVSGYDLESAAMLSGLSLDEVRAIAGTPDADDLVNGAPST